MIGMREWLALAYQGHRDLSRAFLNMNTKCNSCLSIRLHQAWTIQASSQIDFSPGMQALHVLCRLNIQCTNREWVWEVHPPS